MTNILNQNILKIIYEYLDNEIEIITDGEDKEIMSVIYKCKLCNRIVGYPDNLIADICKICFEDNIFFYLSEEIQFMFEKNNYMSYYTLFHKHRNIVNEIWGSQITFTRLIIRYHKLRVLFKKNLINENMNRLNSIIKELKLIRNILLFVNN